MRTTLPLLLIALSPWFVTGQTPRAGPPATGLAPQPLPPGRVDGTGNRLTEVAPPAETLRSFDPARVQVAWHNRRWLLAHDGEVLKDFGTSEYEARTALRLIQEFGLNQLGTIGTPNPVMEYWLCGGRAPQGSTRSGLRTLPLDPARLRVEQLAGQWCLREGARTLCCFGPHRDDALRAHAVIHHYRFDQVLVVGQVTPSMYVFLSRNAGAVGLQSAGPDGRAMAGPRFSRLVKNADGSPKFQRTPERGVVAAQGLEGIDRLAQPVIPALHQAPAVRDGRQDFRWRTQPGFARAPVGQGDRVPFDWRQVQLRQDGADWNLVSGGLRLISCGPNQQDARLALSAVRHYRFTEQHRFGGDQPYMTYFTAPGTAPRSVMLGLQAVEFQPDKLELKKVESGYALCQGEKVIVRLREREEDGTKLLESIRRNRYDRLCRIGEPGREAMTFLVRTR